MADTKLETWHSMSIFQRGSGTQIVAANALFLRAFAMHLQNGYQTNTFKSRMLFVYDDIMPPICRDMLMNIYATLLFVHGQSLPAPCLLQSVRRKKGCFGIERALPPDRWRRASCWYCFVLLIDFASNDVIINTWL